MTEDANPLYVGLRPHAATTTDVLWDPDRFGVADRVGLLGLRSVRRQSPSAWQRWRPETAGRVKTA
jgi:hypothetical protein